MSSAAVRQDPAPSARRQAVLLLLCWLAITGVVVLVGKAVTGPVADVVRPPDNDAVRWFAARRSSTLTEAAQDISLLADFVTTLVLTAVLLVVFWFWLRQLRPLVFLAAVTLGELATYLVTVALVPRPRPPVPRLDPGLDPLHSYPSGHVAAALATYGGLAVVLWIVDRRHWRWAVPLLFLPAVLVGAARLYLGVHHPTDILASVLFMSVWLGCCARILLE